MPDDILKSLPGVYVFVAAMLVYRSIDLLTAREKIQQIALRTVWWQNGRPPAGPLLRKIRQKRGGANASLRAVKILRSIQEEADLYFMCVLLAVLALVGGVHFAAPASMASSTTTTYAVAFATALVSTIVSTVNWLIEHYRTTFST